MEWTRVQHLDLRHVARGQKPQQPHYAVFKSSQAVVAVAVGTHIIEFDCLTGSKISSIDIGARVVRMSYSPTNVDSVIAILDDGTIRSCDFSTEQTLVLHTIERRTDSINIDSDVHMALTPLEPSVFFGFPKRMSVTVVGTVEGVRAPTKIKTDLKKSIVNVACHPRLPVLYVAYVEGLVRAYNIQTYAVLYTLQLDPTIKLLGAGAFAFHPTLEWVFIGDRGGTLLAWDVSTERPTMIGITQAGSHPITCISWISTLRLLVTLSKDGTLQVWKTRVVINPNRQPMEATFFEKAGIEALDITKILSQDGEGVYPLPRMRTFSVHPKFNLAAATFADMSNSDNVKNRAAYTREGRRQLFAVLQSARGSTAAVLKEKLAALGSSGILADHQLQAQLQEQQAKGQSQLTISDIARKAFLHSHFMEGHAKSGPVSRLPLITISDAGHLLRDVPVCQPYHLELNFFNKKEQRVVQYPAKAFYLDGFNLMAHNLSSGADNIYKKLYSTIPSNVECLAKSVVYSSKQNMFMVVFELSGPNGVLHEVVLYWEQTDPHSVNSKGSSVKGRDAAFMGPVDNQYCILDEDKVGLLLYTIPRPTSKEELEKTNQAALDENSFAEAKADSNKKQGPLQFVFDAKVDRIFSTPIDATVLYAINGKHVALAKLLYGYRLSPDNSQEITTKTEGKKFFKLKPNEIVLQVQWQETLRGHVAGILTNQRVLITTADLDILSISSTKYDIGLPSYRSILWVGPALLFSSATGISMLGWDNKVRSILSMSFPRSVMLGALNDRILIVNPTDINPRQKKGVEVKSCQVGLLEPLLIGFATMQQRFEQKIDLSEVLYQITSRFDSTRITPRSLDILAKGPPVCGDLAVTLSQAGPQFTQVLRCNYAIKALRFSSALSILKDEYLRSRDYPQCPPTSILFMRFRELGYACIKYGQFDSAKETFEVISDYESMLDLFICHLNPSAMRRLAEKLEEISLDSEIRRHLERILRVRSTTWSQGGIFANFAAESMVPKGPEWAGGNWEIKTPATTKPIPAWEISAEVMPYMRTSEGSIPTIVADHIGIYLGMIRGRTNVVEVSEKSLVMPSNVGPSGENKPVTTPALKPDDSAGGSLARQLGIASGVAPAAEDQQAKAAEEFRRSMQGVTDDGASSDEEDSTSKTRKIQIRIRDKPVAGPADVNMLKEATKSLGLVAPPGPPARTRSLTLPPPAGPPLPQPQDPVQWPPAQPTPPPAATMDLFVTDSFTAGQQMQQPAPGTGTGPVVAGMGVSAAPIPEDFFQNTISSLQVAASAAAILPPEGQILSQVAQGGVPRQGGPVQPVTSVAAPNQSMMNVGLPDGGVPPQAPQIPQQGPTFTAIGLPDGGVPPQSQLQSQVQQQQQLRPLQPMGVMPSQPIDLGALEGSAAPAKPAGPAPPTAVRPGQVPRGAPASDCYKIGLAHLEQNQLADALSCLDEAFLALAKDQSRDVDVKAQATICAHYKIAVALLQEIARLQKVQGAGALSAKDEMARLSRHLAALPLQAKHRINCIRTAIKRNMEVQNFAYAKQQLDLLYSKAPPNKQDELRSLIDMCLKRGLTNKSIDPFEDPSQFCAATLGRLSTIGHDMCDLCGAKFSAVSAPGCIICGMGRIKRSDAAAGPASSPFG
ncbi:Transducin/WD40 repeat-like superfamily protein [Rhynchospora pubera]|uniref:Transducin/WD40 repeat-like superfamily protein n=1 Tax=Rhynchospora pubera TaxID=906938 RepID=A0AAV8E0V4_9POAL|nr:Transducin/WD40 repeat-like superfamily protein [Rhynchospora pubera]